MHIYVLWPLDFKIQIVSSETIWGNTVFKFSAQVSDLAPFVGYGIKIEIHLDEASSNMQKKNWIQHSTIPLKPQAAMPCAIGVFLHTYKERFLSVYKCNPATFKCFSFCFD